jgi:cytochrome bd ubiquinol oxidase subunit II
MALINIWFAVIAVLWIGFLVLDGFDLGVGALHGIIGGDEPGRRQVISTIAPVWDGNEVWLIVAAGATFAAFPSWFATLFSALYLPFFLLLVALIARGVSFEFRAKSASPASRRFWDTAMTAGSLTIPLIIGIAFGNLLHGVPIDADQDFTGDLLDLLNPYTLGTGLTVAAVCLLHGATYLCLRTAGPLRERAVTLACRLGPVTALVVLGFAAWTVITAGQSGRAGWTAVPGGIAVAAVVAANPLIRAGRDGRAFVATSVTMAAVVATIFVALHPRVMVSTLGPANDLTASNTAASRYALTIITVVAAVLLPVVLAYQAWSLHVFRRRIDSSANSAR